MIFFLSVFFFLQAENIYNDEDPDTSAADLECQQQTVS